MIIRRSATARSSERIHPRQVAISWRVTLRQVFEAVADLNNEPSTGSP